MCNDEIFYIREHICKCDVIFHSLNLRVMYVHIRTYVQEEKYTHTQKENGAEGIILKDLLPHTLGDLCKFTNTFISFSHSFLIHTHTCK